MIPAGVQYGAHDQISSPTREEREKKALEKAAQRGRGNASAMAERKQLLAEVQKLIQAELRKAQGKDGITVKWPIISGSGRAKGGEEADTIDVYYAAAGEIGIYEVHARLKG